MGIFVLEFGTNRKYIQFKLFEEYLWNIWLLDDSVANQWMLQKTLHNNVLAFAALFHDIHGGVRFWEIQHWGFGKSLKV